MASRDPASGGPAGAGAPSEEELRARLEEEMRKIQVGDVLLQTVVTLVNLAGQRLGLTESTRELRDPAQARLAIESVRALMPLLESDPELGKSVGPIRDALSQLQLAYANEAGAGAAGEAPEGGAGQAQPAQPAGEAPPAPRGPGGGPGQPRRRSTGRLWTPPGSG
jgi:hypothetical protein